MAKPVHHDRSQSLLLTQEAHERHIKWAPTVEGSTRDSSYRYLARRGEQGIPPRPAHSFSPSPVRNRAANSDYDPTLTFEEYVNVLARLSLNKVGRRGPLAEQPHPTPGAVSVAGAHRHSGSSSQIKVRSWRGRPIIVEQRTERSCSTCGPGDDHAGPEPKRVYVRFTRRVSGSRQYAYDSSSRGWPLGAGLEPDPPPVWKVSPSGARTRSPIGLSARRAAALRTAPVVGRRTLRSTNRSPGRSCRPPSVLVATSGCSCSEERAEISSVPSPSESVVVTSCRSVASTASPRPPRCSITSPLCGSR
ncbi:hypothetical protein T492DRAFT_100189 [Pavlovales sp. CCMP2436]|nr:hypothetical protein T492DRAFT_100189 [Pavlovales sp. CCMP2436]